MDKRNSSVLDTVIFTKHHHPTHLTSTYYIICNQRNFYIVSAQNVLSDIYSDRFKNFATGSHGNLCCLTITQIHHFSDARLHENFRTLVTWKQSGKDRTSWYVLLVLVHYRIHLRMTNERIFSVSYSRPRGPTPRKTFIVTYRSQVGESVITNPYYFFAIAHYACTHLGLRIFRSLCR